MKSKKVVVLANPVLFWGYIIVFLGVMGGGCIAMIACLSTVWRDSMVNGDSRIVFGVMFVLLCVSAAFTAPRWWIFITLSENEIRYKAAFHKPASHPYAAYRYVYRGTYWHGSLVGVGFRPRYLILSQRKMTTEELTQINHVMPSEKVIKLRYSGRVHRKLSRILPESCRRQVDGLFGTG